MAKKNCSTKQNQKTIFSRVKTLPAELVPGTVYIVSDGISDFVDMYVADNKGNKKSIIDLSRFLNSKEDISLTDYRSDIMNLGTDYFYGYEYIDNSFKIIKVKKGNVVKQLKAINTTGTFDTNWNNRQTLTYN